MIKQFGKLAYGLPAAFFFLIVFTSSLLTLPPFGRVTAAGETEAQEGGLHVAHGWARATAGQARNGAAYFVIHMPGQGHDRLIGASSTIAKKTELHTHKEENGIMKMRPLHFVEIGPGEHSAFQPGGNHVMLMGLHAPLQEGQTFPLKLQFEKAGEIEVEIEVMGVAASGPGHGHDQGHGEESQGHMDSGHSHGESGGHGMKTEQEEAIQN